MENTAQHLSDTHSLFGTSEVVGDVLRIEWQGESWHGYEGCPGRQFFEDVRVERITAYKHDPDGTPVFNIPSNMQIIE